MWERVSGGATALAPRAELAALPDPRAAVVPGPDLRPWLARRKDERLLARAAKLALPAAGRAVAGFVGDRQDLALFVAVGREPPDEGECEPALAAMETDGRLDLGKLGGDGRALYPPLLPLRTLPNMVLAWVSIQYGIRGENACFAGGSETAAAVLAEALATIRDGRATHALVGAAWSGVDLASARDRLRVGDGDPPGEGALFALLGPGGAPVPALTLSKAARERWRAALGDLGPVEGWLALLEPPS